MKIGNNLNNFAFYQVPPPAEKDVNKEAPPTDPTILNLGDDVDIFIGDMWRILSGNILGTPEPL